MKFILFIAIVFAVQLSNAQDQMYDICPLKVGEELPAVSLTDAENKAHTLADLTTDKPAVIIFYRGAWCGYCTKHLAELNDIKTAVAELGYQMFGVTVDQASKLEESTRRSESEIPVFSDAKLEVIKAFGLDWEVESTLFEKYKEKYKLDLEAWSGEDHHGLTVPAIFVVKDGIVQFQYVNPNYRLRLKPATLLAVLETL